MTVVSPSRPSITAGTWQSRARAPHARAAHAARLSPHRLPASPHHTARPRHFLALRHFLFFCS